MIPDDTQENPMAAPERNSEAEPAPPSRGGTVYHIAIQQGSGIAIGDGAQVYQSGPPRSASVPPSAAPPLATGYPSAVLRELLTAAYSDEALDQLCYDYFRSVYEQFSTGMSRGAKVQRLLAYCEQQEQLPQLLARVEADNPHQYDRYRERLQP